MSQADETKPKRRGRVAKDGAGKAGFKPGDAAAPAFEPEGLAVRLQLWWEDGDGASFIVKCGQSWSRWPEKKVVNLMRREYVRVKARDGETLSEAEQTLLWVMENRRVDVATTALAGYPSGIYDIQGQRVLVRSSPSPIVPVEGEWGMVKALIDAKLDLRTEDEDGHGIDQTPYFHAWMKLSLDALWNGGPGNFRPGQCLIFAGGRDVGKSRLQHQIITPLLGGRSADPGPYLFGRTDFNGDMIGSEHLMMEDPASSTLTKDRVYFGEMIKQMVVNDTQRLHKKREDAIVVTPFFRVSISVNDDPDKMRVLPLLSPDIKDKLHIFRVGNAPLPMAAESLEERAAFRARIASELPAYAWWLLNIFQVPEELRHARMGVKHWHHPGLAMELFDDTPAAELLGIIDAAIFTHEGEGHKGRRLWDLKSRAPMDEKAAAEYKGHRWWQGKAWEGTSNALEEVLLSGTDWSCSVMSQAKKLSMHNSVSRMVARLAQDRPERVWEHRVKTERRWVVARGD